MSQIFKSINGGAGVVDSVTGANGVNATPTTGNVVVSGINATTSTVGVASFNPANFTVSGGGQVSLLGTGVMETLTPNSGGAVSPVAGNINDQGLAANAGGNAFPLFSYNGGAGQVNWENRAYLSAYVVDVSSTNGSKGTFSTLGAAITQAIADGATGAPGVAIYIRNVTITETITVSTNGVNISILGTGGKSNIELAAGNPIFNGSFTNSGNGNIIFSNIDFTSSATLTNSGSGSINIDNSYCLANITNSGSGSFDVGNCWYNGTKTLSGGSFSSDNSFHTGSVVFSNSASYALYYCTDSSNLSGSTSNTLSFNNSYVNFATNTMSSGTFINFNSTFSASNYYGNSSIIYEMANSTAGNTYQAVRSAISYVAIANQDYYIGITSTSAPRTVTLPSVGVIKNQSFIIKDESGGAAANNISVTVAGGTKTIDGVTTYPITVNYGSITVIYDGTNYFII